MSIIVKLPRLAYMPTDRRDLRLDFLRGFAALAMIVDHIGGASWLYALTGGNRFFTSAAESFVFISGLVVGVVYRGFIERDGLGPALRRVMERAAQLYLLAVALTLVFLPVSEMIGLKWAQGVDLSDAPAFVVSVFTLHRTYYVVDIPLLYALLLGITPLILLLLHQRRTPLVLGASWALWAAYQFFPDEADMPWSIAGNYAFHFSAWQVLFVTAIVLGYHRERISAALSRIPRGPALVLSAVAFGALVQIYRLGDAVWRRLPVEDPATLDVTEVLVMLFGKGDLRPGRLLAFAVVFVFFYLLVDRLWRPLDWSLGWLLLPLGQSALYAYAVHVVFVLIAGLLLPFFEFPERYAKGIYTAIQLTLVGLTWWMIRVRLFLPRQRHWSLWVGSTAAMAMACLVIVPLDPTPTLPGWGTAEVQAATDPATTPDPRLARAYGTPVPRDGRAPAFEPRQPLIRRAPVGSAPVPQARGEASQVNRFVGPIKGTFREHWFYSPALDDEQGYYIYLPPDYDSAKRRYPVLYLLHGAAADREEWLAYGVVDAADRMIVSLEIQPLILVFPQGDYGYWVNHINDGPRWGDYVARNLVRHIDATYRTLPMASRRAIGGLSMGGHGSLQLAMNFPGVFQVVGAHSPSLREDDGEIPFLGRGDEWDRRDPLWLAQYARGLEHLKVWIDTGDEDVYSLRADPVQEALKARGVEVHWHITEGREHGEWERYIEDYLRFYDYALNAR